MQEVPLHIHIYETFTISNIRVNKANIGIRHTSRVYDIDVAISFGSIYYSLFFFLLFHSFPMNQSPLVKQMTLSAVVDDDEMSPGRKSPRDTLHNLIHIEPYSSGRRWRTTKTVPEFMTFYHRIAYIKPFFFCIFSS